MNNAIETETVNERNTPVLEVSRLCKSFAAPDGGQTVEVLHDVSFTVNPGEFVAVMGPSGCGKSTLLYLLGGLDQPTSGSVKFDGREIHALSDGEQSRIRRCEIGFVFQFYNLVQNLTVEENVFLPLGMAGERPAAHKTEIDALLERLGLTDKRRAMPSALSGGQQQRVAVARAVVSGCKLLLCDEPTGNLDSASGESVMDLFAEIHRDLKPAIVMVTHDEKVARRAERLLTMKDGVIVADEKI